MVTKLQEEITQNNNHIRELEAALASNKNDLALKIDELTQKNMKLERSMNEKQVFSEKLMNENKNLINRLEQIRNQEIMENQDVPDGLSFGNRANVSFASLIHRGNTV